MFNLPGANRMQPVPGTLAPPIDAPVPSAPVSFPQAAAFGGAGGTNANMARQSRRLYVGSITYEANEDNIAAFFNAKMVETGLGTGAPGDAVIGIQINHEKSYAFVEVSQVVINCVGGD
jgi:splicing factor U2AF subunit